MEDAEHNQRSFIHDQRERNRRATGSADAKRRQRESATGYGGCCGSLAPLLTGLILGILVGGVALAIFLTLYVLKPVARVSTVTVIVTVPVNITATNASTVTNSTASNFNANLVQNGDGETGTCDANGTITSPVGWTVSGPISQVFYANNSVFTDQNYITAGPSDRGTCYFMGHVSAYTSMWQTIDLTKQVDSALIDALAVKFNLSAWIGGLTLQDDSVLLSLTFLDQRNRMVGSSINLGPVLSVDRGNVSALIFQQTNGILPVTARLVTLLVAITRTIGAQNNGDIDNIAFYLFQ